MWEIKGFLTTTKCSGFMWVWLTWQIQYQDLSPSHWKSTSKWKKRRNNTGNASNTLVGMEMQGRTGKISKWICTVAWSTSLYILWMEKQLSSRRAAIYAFIIHCKRSEFLNGNCTQITQGNISNMEKDLKGLISKTDYLIYMLLGLSFQIITGKTGLIYFPYIWHIFLC